MTCELLLLQDRRKGREAVSSGKTAEMFVTAFERAGGDNVRPYVKQTRNKLILLAGVAIRPGCHRTLLSKPGSNVV